MAPQSGRGAGGAWGDGVRNRLRTLVRVEGGSNRAFARHCGISPARVSEWLGGMQLPSLTQLRVLSKRTGVSLDWLVLGEGGAEPAYHNQTRTRNELELDLAVAVRREIHRRESRGVFDVTDTQTRIGLTSWWVDGRGILEDAVEAEEQKVRQWITFEEETKTLDGISQDILSALRAIVPHLPATDKDLGKAVYQLGAAAQEARSIRSALKPPKEANAYRGLSARSLGGPVVEPKRALRLIEHELKAGGESDPNPIQRRLADGRAVFAPMGKRDSE